MKKKLQAQELMVWATIGSIVMLFAGFTSAYIVKKNQSNWIEFKLPTIFWLSTIIIILSSLFLLVSIKQFKNNHLLNYKINYFISFILAILFIYLQVQGFKQINKMGIQLVGETSNAAASFLLVINLVHIIHVMGGLVTAVIVFFRNQYLIEKEKIIRNLQLLSIYWHFVGILWIYLFIFYTWIA